MKYFFVFIHAFAGWLILVFASGFSCFERRAASGEANLTLKRVFVLGVGSVYYHKFEPYSLFRILSPNFVRPTLPYSTIRKLNTRKKETLVEFSRAIMFGTGFVVVMNNE